MINFRSLTSARTGNIENTDRIVLDPANDVVVVRIVDEINDVTRTLVPVSKRLRECRTARQNPGRQNQSAIGFLNIPLGAFGVSATRRFTKRILRTDCAVFGLAPARAPTSTRHTSFERDIQSRPIDTRLPAGNDFFNQYNRPNCLRPNA